MLILFPIFFPIEKSKRNLNPNLAKMLDTTYYFNIKFQNPN